ncbi:MAG: glycosyltransferase family 9 protein [Flavobacteriaceae bacterium]|nr:glycosyltransferase family 9 protein [Flavobacteriaceae bacterium]
MSILKNINVARRRLMHNITKNIGKSHFPKNVNLNAKIEVEKVLICRPNHRLGNLLLITPLVQEVIATFPECKIDLLVQGGLAPILFENYKNVDKIIQLPKKPFKNLIKYIQGIISVKKRRYDLVINAVIGSSSGKLYTLMANSKYKIFGEDNEDIQLKFKDHEHIAKYQVYSYRNYLSKLGFENNDKPVIELNIKLSTHEIKSGQKILKELVNNEKKIICLFTHATGDKCYSEFWWTIFYKKLKIEFPNYNIIEVLPIENISKIAFKAPSFYSKDIRELGSVIANTEVFIGADSGIMHLASASQTPTVGLFSRDNQKSYEPFGNKSVAINTNHINTTECIKIINDILI